MHEPRSAAKTIDAFKYMFRICSFQLNCLHVTFRTSDHLKHVSVYLFYCIERILTV